MKESLSSADRQFLRLIARAVSANPFGEERTQTDLEIVGCSARLEDENLVSATAERVHGFLEELQSRGIYSIHGQQAEDAYLLSAAHLFDVFHQFLEPYDSLIRRQLSAQEQPVEMPEATDVIGSLVERGFTRQDAVKYLAIFYQMRRAYYFIDVALVGQSPCMKQLRLSLWNNVFTHEIRLYDQYLWNRMEDFSTLLLGETGTGKGTAASAIGRSGFIPFDERRQTFAESFMRSFLTINLSQFSESLIESELFGHKKGAFTGAVDAHEGIFQRCSPHGAIFLDEIGDVSIPIQIKLLQVLQERVFYPVGSHQQQRFHGRVIAATNRKPDSLRKAKLLRDDFFYRLSSDVITVPTLRQRLAESSQELDDLLHVTVERLIGTRSQEMVDLAHAAIAAELGPDYPWPGNVRELEQCVRRVVLTRHYSGDRQAVSQDLEGQLIHAVQAGAYDARALLSAYCALLHGRHGTYEEVARRTKLDRRTVKKYVEEHRDSR